MSRTDYAAELRAAKEDARDLGVEAWQLRRARYLVGIENSEALENEALGAIAQALEDGNGPADRHS